MLSEGSICAFDLDKCRDPATGALAVWARQLLEECKSYAEITPSGTGLRIIGYGRGEKVHQNIKLKEKLEGLSEAGSLEIYRNPERYITVTGDVLDGYNLELVNIDAAIDRHKRAEKAQGAPKRDAATGTAPKANGARRPCPAAVLEAIESDANDGERSDRLYWVVAELKRLSVASSYERVVFMKAAQIGATEAALNFCGHVIENAPGVLLYVSPTDAASQRNVRLRVDPLIDTTPELAALVTRRRSRMAGNNNSLKTFPGGQLSFVGANSAVGLRSTPARYIICDEVDAFPADADSEGDPISLAIQRTVTFAGRRKIFLLSTPTLEGVSRIAKAFDEGDQRQYHVPCPHCGTLQVLEWKQVRWPGEDRAKAFMLCPHCGEGISERHKQSMVAEGVWMPTAEGDGKTASFHLSAFYSPFISWSEIALEHEACGNDPTRLQTWTNCSLGETWEDKQATYITPAQLLTRAAGWGEMLPDEVVRITGSCDVQMDRLEVEIVGWGKGEQSWSLDYISLPGNPSLPEIWTHLDDIRKQKFPHRKLGTLGISAFCVDSGNWSKSVYAYPDETSLLAIREIVKQERIAHFDMLKFFDELDQMTSEILREPIDWAQVRADYEREFTMLAVHMRRGVRPLRRCFTHPRFAVVSFKPSTTRVSKRSWRGAAGA